MSRRIGVRDAGAALAMAWLALVGGLLVWSVAPVAWGWQPRLVLSGSMQPDLHPGDVVLTSRLTDPASLGVGQVLAVQAPDLASGSYLHRMVRLEPGALVVTRGDANPSDDFPAVPVARVLGQARYVIPIVGRPVLWSRQGNPWPLAGVVVLTGLALATLGRAGARTPAVRGQLLRGPRPFGAGPVRIPLLVRMIPLRFPDGARSMCAVASVAALAAGVAGAGLLPVRPTSDLSTLDRFLPAVASTRPASPSGCLVTWVLPGELPAGLGYDVLDGSGAVLGSGITGSSATVAVPHPGGTLQVRARYGSWTSRLEPLPAPSAEEGTATPAAC